MNDTIRTVRALLQNTASPAGDHTKVILEVKQHSGEIIWPDFITHDDKVYRNTLTTLWGARVYSQVPACPARISEDKWDELAKGS